MARAGEGPRAASGSDRPQPPDSAVGRRARTEAREGRRRGPPASSGPGGPRRPGRSWRTRVAVRASLERGFGEPGRASATPGKRDGLLLLACFPRGFAPLSLSLPLLFQYRLRPISSLPSWQLEMTGCERTSDVRGQPAPGGRFQGTASNPPPAPGPPKPPSLQHWPLLSARLHGPPAQAPLTALIRPFWNCLPGYLPYSSGRAFPPDNTMPCLSL